MFSIVLYNEIKEKTLLISQFWTMLRCTRKFILVKTSQISSFFAPTFTTWIVQSILGKTDDRHKFFWLAKIWKHRDQDDQIVNNIRYFKSNPSMKQGYSHVPISDYAINELWWVSWVIGSKMTLYLRESDLPQWNVNVYLGTDNESSARIRSIPRRIRTSIKCWIWSKVDN